MKSHDLTNFWEADSEEQDCTDYEEELYLIIDNGSNMIKAGCADDDAPRVVIPTVAGQPKVGLTDVLNFGNGAGTTPCFKDWYFGDEAVSKRGILSLQNPIQNGHIQDWEAMYRLWNHIIWNLRGAPMEPHTHYLLTYSPVSTKAEVKKSFEILLETIECQSLYFEMSEVLSLYSSGSTSGLVVSSGHDMTYSVPIFEGKVISPGISHSAFGGKHTTDFLATLMQSRGYTMTTHAEMGIVRDMKEKLTSVAGNLDLWLACMDSKIPYRDMVLNSLVGQWGEELNPISKIISQYLPKELVPQSRRCRHYELPSGTLISIEKEQFECPELLFNPSMYQKLDQNHKGIHELASSSISACDAEIQKAMSKTIVLSGGNTMFEGIQERLNDEIAMLQPDHEVAVVAPPDRKYSSWIGGSILSRLTTFHDLWIEKSDYEEIGSSIVDRFLISSNLSS